MESLQPHIVLGATVPAPQISDNDLAYFEADDQRWHEGREVAAWAEGILLVYAGKRVRFTIAAHLVDDAVSCLVDHGFSIMPWSRNFDEDTRTLDVSGTPEPA